MSKSTADRLRRTVSGVPGTSRRQQYSAATKRALVDVAEELFTEHGYAGASLDAIVAGAEVTKGALYHHFSGKQGLFEAVFDRIEEEATRSVEKALRDRSDPWERALAGLRAFLEVARKPAYRRVIVQDGPAVLGYERYREREERSTYGTVQDIVDSMLGSGEWRFDDEMVETFSRVFFGAMSSAGEMVATSEDVHASSERVETTIGLILTGLRGLVDAAEQPPGTTAGA